MPFCTTGNCTNVCTCILFDISQYRPLEGGNTNKMKVASRTGDKCFCSGMRLSLCLPPADEVLGKVIFSQASVILSTGRRAWQGGVRVGGVHGWGGGVTTGM